MDTISRPVADRRAAAVLSFLAASDLTTFAWLAADAGRAPDLAAREALSRRAAEQVAHYDEVAALLVAHGGSREDVAPYLGMLEEVGTRTEPGSWEERVLRTGLVGGMVHDLGEVLAQLLPADVQGRVLADRHAPDVLVVELVGRRLAEDEPLRARLSLWGRRIAGEALGVLPPVTASIVAASDGEAAEISAPAMSEMSGRHARRMDRLGLTA